MWPPLGGGSPHCANTRTACASSWRCTMSIIISACPMPASACRCHSPCRPTGRAPPRRGGRGPQRWLRGCRIGCGPSGRCCSFACRRGRSQQGCEQAGGWETATGGNLRGDVRLHGRLRGHHHGAEGCSDVMRALPYRPFCPFDGRRVSLWYLSAGGRYTAQRRINGFFSLSTCSMSAYVSHCSFQDETPHLPPLQFPAFV